LKKTISWEDFEKIDIRVGTILSAEVLISARVPAYVLTIDFGIDIGIKKSSARITRLYKVDELVGTQILAVVNFPPKQIGKIISEVLVLGLYKTQDEVVLIRPFEIVENGLFLG